MPETFFSHQPQLLVPSGSVSERDSGYEVACGTSILRIEFIEGYVRIRASKNGEFLKEPSLSVEKKTRAIKKASVSLDQRGYVITSEHLTVWIDKINGTLAVRTPSGQSVAEGLTLGFADERPTISLRLTGKEKVFGTGMRSRPLNRRGYSVRMWTHNTPSPKENGDSMYACVPFAMIWKPGATRGVFFDNTWKAELDSGGRIGDRLSYQALGGEIDVYLFPGPSPSEVLYSFTDLTGRIERPPRWVTHFGYSRYGTHGMQAVKQRVLRYRELGIPVSTIYLDLDYMKDNVPWTWDKEEFGDPSELISWLHQNKIEVVLIMDPLIPIRAGYEPYEEGMKRNLYCKSPSGEIAIVNGFAGSSVVPDFTKPETVEFFSHFYRDWTEKYGVYWWQDKTEPAMQRKSNQAETGQGSESDREALGDIDTVEGDQIVHQGADGIHSGYCHHNTFCIQNAQAAYRGQREARPNKRVFTLARAQWAGMQRIAWAWNGDVYSNHGSLANSVTQLMNLGLSGLVGYGTDVGGFFGNCTAELMMRWIQWATFTPLMRIHSVHDCVQQTPWTFGDRCREVTKRFIELRSQLMPLTYDLLVKASQTGEPLMRPMYMDCFEEDIPEHPVIDYQYFWGPFLVAPVVDEGHRGKTVYLPSHSKTWYDFWEGKEYEGGRMHHVPAPEELIPLFLPAGGIFPMGPVVKHATHPEPNLVVHMYSGGKGSYVHHIDDGETYDYQRGICSQIAFDFEGTRDEGVAIVHERTGNYDPGPRDIIVRVHILRPGLPPKVWLDGKEMRWFGYIPDNGGHFDVVCNGGKSHKIEYRY